MNNVSREFVIHFLKRAREVLWHAAINLQEQIVQHIINSLPEYNVRSKKFTEKNISLLIHRIEWEFKSTPLKCRETVRLLWLLIPSSPIDERIQSTHEQNEAGLNCILKFIRYNKQTIN